MSETALLAQGKEITPVEGGTVEVVAPADLKEGYVLSVTVNGAVRSVTVPAGGVKEGQSFQATPHPSATGAIPSGHWRDGLCDCFKFGCCHAMCCLGWCFQPILTGQVMTRMSLNWMGGPGQRPSLSKTCQIVTGIYLGFVVFQTIMTIVLDSQTCAGGHEMVDPDTFETYILCPDGSKEIPNSTYMVVSIILSAVGSLYGLYLCLITCHTRAAIRAKFRIPTGSCGGCEDCCCAVCCPCCTVQQMARHTNDYATHNVACCSGGCLNNRGQPIEVPEIDV